MENSVENTSAKAEKLSAMVGESEKLLVSSSVDTVVSDFNALKETLGQRHSQLDDALADTHDFQANLVDVLNWLQGRLYCSTGNCSI